MNRPVSLYEYLPTKTRPTQAFQFKVLMAARGLVVWVKGIPVPLSHSSKPGSVLRRFLPATL